MRMSVARVLGLLMLIVGGIVLGLVLRHAVRQVPVPQVDAANRTASFAVQYRQPVAREGLVVQLPDNKGATTIACSTCHSLAESEGRTVQDPGLKSFHQGMDFKHGNLACRACHHQDNYDFLTLGGDETVLFTQVRQVCSQCHTTQGESYLHGAHGGMTGFWDLSRGGRLRNNCVDCHNPHKPAWGRFTPERGPTDKVVPHHIETEDTTQGGRNE